MCSSAPEPGPLGGAARGSPCATYGSVLLYQARSFHLIRAEGLSGATSTRERGSERDRKKDGKTAQRVCFIPQLAIFMYNWNMGEL